jgi:cbb3-type cytochrome oxidase subunit 3
MNPVFRAASESANDMWLMGMMTAIFLAFFVGWTVWAWWPTNRQKMIDAARIPLDDDGE